MSSAALYLASSSPRRKELLAQIGVCFEQFSVDIDEAPFAGESPGAYVLRMAKEKAVAARCQVERQNLPILPVLCADTTVVSGSSILGKPSNQDEAVAMLRRLSGSEHEVMSAVAMCLDTHMEVRLSRTRVVFADISDEQALRYWQSGEPADKAGGYGIQGLGAVFVREITGSYSGVVGLPLAETTELLQAFGVPYWVY